MHPVNFYQVKSRRNTRMFALLDCRASEASLSALKSYGYTPILMPPAPYLDGAVASHTDMLLFIGFGRIFCHASYYECQKELIDGIVSVSGLELVVSREKTGDKYPRDVLFNACLVNNKLICNKKSVSKIILDTAENENCEIINVPQGYTKCSICPISENAIITADKSIALSCKGAGMDVLLISEGDISLPPYDFGFIGGASGIHLDKVFFCGSLDRHRDALKIYKFCEKHGKSVVSLSEDCLQDVGSIFFIRD